MTKLILDWNLKDIYNCEQDALNEFNDIKKLNLQKYQFKGKLNNKNDILEYFKLDEKIDEKEIKLFQYLSLRLALNGKDLFARDLQSQIEYFYAENEPKLAFILTELTKNPSKKLLEYASSPEFKNFDIELKDLVEEKKHILDEKVRSVLSQNMAFGSNSQIFDDFENVDLKFGKIKTEDGEKEITHANYGSLLKNKDRKVRKTVYQKVGKAYADFNYTLGGLYLNHAKECVFFSNIHKYKSLIEQSCNSDKTNPKVLYTLIDVVNDHLNLFQKFYKIKKKLFNFKEMYPYDTRLDVASINSKYSYEESVRHVLSALSIMGEDYIKILKEAFESGWMDVYEKENKTHGGFCAPVYGSHPYILLNHNETFFSVSTIAHELGHAVNEYLSAKKQPINKSFFSIFIGEVASTVNEILLIDYMLKNSKDKQEKLFFINELIVALISSVYVQTMYSEFELYVFTSIEEHKNITVEDLNKKYGELNDKYYGDSVKSTEYTKYGWSHILHFYRPYYVYKYATGFISALVIANKILNNEEGFKEKYNEFLSSGSSVKPIELLKTVGVDITKKSTLLEAFKLLDKLLIEFEEILKEK